MTAFLHWLAQAYIDFGTFFMIWFMINCLVGGFDGKNENTPS